MKFIVKNIFLIDGCGALVSTFFLGVVFTTWEGLIEMPKNVLYLLSGIAAMFTIYSLICSFSKPYNWRAYLKVIAIANILYVILTTVCLLIFSAQLTTLGTIYFIAEILVIITLVILEINIIRKA